MDLHDKKFRHWENGRKSISGIGKHGCKWWDGIKLMVFKKQKEGQRKEAKTRPEQYAEARSRRPKKISSFLYQAAITKTVSWDKEMENWTPLLLQTLRRDNEM